MSKKKLRGCSICHQRKDDVFVTRRGGGQAHDTCNRAWEDRRRVNEAIKADPALRGTQRICARCNYMFDDYSVCKCGWRVEGGTRP